MTTAMRMAIEGSALLPLLAWLSPSYPVGGYAYSHGLEWAAESGEVADEASLSAWLSDFVRLGAGRNDAILFAHAHRAAAAGDADALAAVNELALALAPSSELHLETSQQGTSFLAATRAAWPAPAIERLAPEGPLAYPVAVGLAAGAHDLPLEPALDGFLFALVQNLVSAAIRLGVVGQTAGIRVAAALAPAIAAVSAGARTLTLDDVGGSTFRADLGSFLHETQYSRLFRS
ncbi:urease accessory protein UreF [Faunimonas sp. B44]|uniref:urease accessory protein UreF n=1 Tax=Faunimonas sp. B44 TaxID=3461493 RepID=UPI004044F130